MNKTHGLVATAWALGSGMLLDATLIAEAQSPSAPNRSAAQSEAISSESTPNLLPESLRSGNPAPKGTAAKPIAASSNHKMSGQSAASTKSKSRAAVQPAAHQQNAVTAQSESSSGLRIPSLLPESLRSGNKTPSGAVANPIAPNSNHKMSGQTTASAKPKSRAAVQPATHMQTGTPTQQADQNNGQSPIQQQLEELYRKDGRPMPQMNFNQAQAAPANQPNAGTGPSQRPAQKATAGNVVPPTRSKPGLLSRLNPFKSKPMPAPLTPPTVRPAQGIAGQAPYGQPNAVNPIRSAPNQLPQAAQPIAINPAPAAIVTEAAKVISDSGLADTLPPVPGEEAIQDATTSVKVATDKAVGDVDEALNNAFNEAEEATSTKVAVSKEIQTEATEKTDANPFSGLSLDEPAEATPPAPVASDAEPPLELPPVEPSQPVDRDALPLPTESVEVAVDATDEAQQQIEAKMKLIAERGELRGLKGFCPVALRDDRDLKNAMPEHTSTFKGRTYYFSTADAKSAFDENAEHYAPVAGGNDVVLQKTKVTKEGSLDFAVWYKDRLYLFTSQKTLEQFVATPIEFATNE